MLEIIQNEDRFYSMRNDWNRLLEKSRVNNPYLTHEWLSSWWKAYKDNKALNVVVFKQQGQIIGAIPLVLSKEAIFGIPIKVIKFFSDHWGKMDFILTDNKTECITEFFSWFHSAKIADVVILSRMPENSESASVIEEVAKDKKFIYKKTGMKNTVILLQGSWEDYLKQLSRKFRYEIKNKKKTLFGLGEIIFERVREVEDTDKILHFLTEVGTKSWKYKEGKGIIVSKQGLLFYRDIISEWSKTKKLDISLIRHKGIPIAFAFRIKYEDTYYALETAFNQGYYNYSPGLVVNSILLEQLFDEKSANRYELGITTDTKKRWSRNCDLEVKLNIYNKTIKMRILFCLKELVVLFFNRSKHSQETSNET